MQAVAAGVPQVRQNARHAKADGHMAVMPAGVHPSVMTAGKTLGRGLMPRFGAFAQSRVGIHINTQGDQRPAVTKGYFSPQARQTARHTRHQFGRSALGHGPAPLRRVPPGMKGSWAGRGIAGIRAHAQLKPAGQQFPRGQGGGPVFRPSRFGIPVQIPPHRDNPLRRCRAYRVNTGETPPDTLLQRRRNSIRGFLCSVHAFVAPIAKGMAAGYSFFIRPRKPCPRPRPTALFL